METVDYSSKENDALDMATWNRERTPSELRFFIEQHHAALPVDIETE